MLEQIEAGRDGTVDLKTAATLMTDFQHNVAPPAPGDVHGLSSSPTLSASPPSSSFYRWYRRLLLMSYTVVIVLLLVALIPGSWTPDDEDLVPNIGLEQFTFTVQTFVGGGDISYTVTFFLSSTCVIEDSPAYEGDGTCYSNLSAATWSIRRVLQSNWLNQQFPDLNSDAPEISVRIIVALLIVALLLSAWILLLPLLSCCTGTDVRGINKRSRRHWGIVRLQAGLSLIGFMCILAGVVLLEVQVAATVSNLSQAENIPDILISEVTQNSGTYNGVLGAAVGLMGLNSVTSAVDVFWYSRLKRGPIIGGR